MITAAAAAAAASPTKTNLLLNYVREVYLVFETGTIIPCVANHEFLDTSGYVGGGCL